MSETEITERQLRVTQHDTTWGRRNRMQFLITESQKKYNTATRQRQGESALSNNTQKQTPQKNIKETIATYPRRPQSRPDNTSPRAGDEAVRGL